MKKQILLLYLILSTLISKSQFAPINATWHIGIPFPFGWNIESYMKFVNVKDTVINQDTYSIISGFTPKDSIIPESNSLISKQLNVVYYYLKGKKNKLFDVDVKVGDTVNLDLFLLPYDSIASSRVVITDINYVSNSLADDSLRTFKFEVLFPKISWGFGKFTDKVIYANTSNGNLLYQLIDIPRNADDINYLRCYSDSNFEFKSIFVYQSWDLNNVGMENMEHNQTFKIFPNPNHGVFNIQFNNNQKKEIKIYDIEGKLIYSNVTKDLETKIEIQQYHVGLYSITILSEDSFTYHKIWLE